MKKRIGYYVLGGVLLVAFAGFSLSSFNETLTPYVSFDQAREMDRAVQVAGGLVAQSSSYDSDAESLLFTLREAEGDDTIRVRYNGLKPANFEDAISIVAIGRYDGASGEMRADKLLVKCPSKYQGTETKSYG